MKKLIVIALALMMLASLSLTALADDGGFVSSPSNNKAPVIVDWEADCDTTIVVSAYADRTELPAELKAMMEAAYQDIKGAEDLTKLCAELAALAKALNISADKLAVSDLFDVRSLACETEGHSANNHGEIDVVLNADTLENFVGLLHYIDGKWVLVDNAKIEGENLKFAVDRFSPFAIVVETEVGDETPDMGDMVYVGLFALVAVISGAALIVCFNKYRKLSAN